MEEKDGDQCLQCIMVFCVNEPLTTLVPDLFHSLFIDWVLFTVLLYLYCDGQQAEDAMHPEKNVNTKFKSMLF